MFSFSLRLLYSMNHVRRVVTETFKNARFSQQLACSRGGVSCVEFSIDMLAHEKFRLDATDFLERLGLNPGDWRVFLQVPL